MSTRPVDMQKMMAESLEDLVEENERLQNELKEAIYFRFRIHQDITIKQLNIPGRIFARCDKGNGVKDYRVVWWCDGKRNDDWLYEYELVGDPQVA